MTPQAKVEAIWQNRDEIDYARLLFNLTANEIEDRLVGKLQGVAERGQRNLTKKTGLLYIKPYL